jgi:hypothetical protein
VIIDHLAHLLRYANGLDRTAMLEEDPELVASQAGHRVAGAHAPAKQGA